MHNGLNLSDDVFQEGHFSGETEDIVQGRADVFPKMVSGSLSTFLHVMRSYFAIAYFPNGGLPETF